VTDNVDGVLAALADPTRLRLLDDLGRRGRATATALAAGLPVTRQAIVKHLAVLQHAGLVAAERRGREVYFAVRPERLDATAQWMATMAAAWDTRLAAIKHLAERERHD
jgi:DNA-binding transcriptional ArsR family regulator